ncbi:MAG: hypothetical protein SFU25_10885 [Candidatus Caenarcaniphilales bacterium]|nr:hypothetical protein [Candidatus Caenarcaniphilales bacterium]
MKKQEDQLVPCLIDRGVIFNKRDIIRLLQGLDHIEYTEYLNGKPLLKREGYVVEIFEDPAEASLFFNRRVHLNVNSFEYLKINYNFPQEPTEELVEEMAEDVNKEESQTAEPVKELANNYLIEMFMPGGRSIGVRPLNDPIENPTSLMSEVEERRRALTEWEEVTADVEED